MQFQKATVLMLAMSCACAQAAQPEASPAKPPMPATSATPAASATPAVPVSSEPPIRKLDGHLVDLKGRGIYTYDGDKTLGVSSCTTQCRLLWPPISADAGDQPKGPFTIAVRPDGTKQWALRGRPLYRWTSDKKYGDAGGDGVAGVWRLVKVSPPKSAAGAAPGTAAAGDGAGKPSAPVAGDGAGKPSAPPTGKPAGT